MVIRFLIASGLLASCSEANVACIEDRTEVTRDEARDAGTCDGELCISQIVAKNHNYALGERDEARQRYADFVTLSGPAVRNGDLSAYTLIRDDITRAPSALHVAEPFVDATTDTVLLIADVCDEPGHVLFDLSSNWGTVRLHKDRCEVDRVYYPDIDSEPGEDIDGDGEDDIWDDIAWQRRDCRVDQGDCCSLGFETCWEADRPTLAAGTTAPACAQQSR